MHQFINLFGQTQGSNVLIVRCFLEQKEQDTNVELIVVECHYVLWGQDRQIKTVFHFLMRMNRFEKP